ncbi:MAG: FG-GAP repeat protein, partial [Verrucomicrobiae bacterium]|nr:FG-GAP repeat protein [Verrucomicrobiae bacterium]
LSATDGGSGDDFGSSVSLMGYVALIGSRFSDGLVAGSGAAYVFDVRSGNQLAKLEADDGAASDSFGFSVSLSGNLALIGAQWDGDTGAFSGSAYVFDLASGKQLTKLTAADGASDDYFGSSVALCGNQALIGSIQDDDLGNNSGSAYFFREISGPMPLMTLAQTRDFAPGTVEADFAAILDPVINPEGESAFAGALTGPGAGGGTARRGIWSDAATDNPLGLAARGGTEIGGGVLVNATMKPIFNRPDDILFQGSVRGTGVNGSNNTALFHSTDGDMPTAFLRKGDGYPEFSGAVLNQFLEVCQSHDGALADVAVAFRYRFGPGGVSSISDTGILAMDHDGTLRDFFNEDWFLDSLADTKWAQFTPRVAMVRNQMAWSAFLKGAAVTPADNMGLFQVQPGASQETWVARKGDGFSGATLRAFLGEGINLDEVVTYRISLSGAGPENEKLQFGYRNVWTKGDLVSNIDPNIAPGARIVRLLSFWPIGGDRVIFLTKLSGPGVNGSNDCVLWLWDDHNGFGATQLLMREGDCAPGCDGAKIRSIQRVDVSPQNGNYVILVSLTGSPAANQALYAGSSDQSVDGTFAAFNLPVMKLRKGTSYQAPLGETTKIHSLVLTNTNDRFGVGAKGGPQIVNDQGHFVICVQFTDRSKELMKGGSDLSCDP